ncbi:MAG: hypothetical protein RLZZ08_1897 [Pseudomonadota bacterium]|jgi:chorismate-pyruvate lyase
MRRLIACIAPLALASCATVQHDRLSQFEAVLAAQDSATAALGQWCSARAIAQPATIRAEPVAGAAIAASPAIRKALGVGAQEPVAYRHVDLICGGTVLSRAHNWYVPSRLTAEMNQRLTTSDAPFGTVVAPLGFHRERGKARHGAAPQCPHDTVLSHSAVLRLPDGRAISTVVECYTPANLR